MGVTIPRGSRALSQAQYAHINEFLGVSVENGVLSADPRFTSYCMNMTSPTTGGIERRWGCQTLGVTMAGGAQAAYWSQAVNEGFIQIGTGIYSTVAWGGFVLVATVSTSNTGYFVDFVGKLIFVHPIDGTFSYDGVTWTLVSAAAIGTCAAVFQNKLWVTGTPAGFSPSSVRVRFSDAGATTNIGVGANFVDIREVDDSPVIAIGSGVGLDFQNLSGLLVFKANSTYRINNSTTGAYTTLSAESGAAGPRAVTSVGSKVVIFSGNGIWVTDTLTPPVRVSQQIQRWFTSFETELSAANLAKVCAGTKNGRVYFAFRRKNSSYNSSILEYDPDRNAFYPHVLATATTTPATPDPTREGYGGVGIADFVQYPSSSGMLLYGVNDASGTKALDMFKVGVYADDAAVNGTNYLSVYRLPQVGGLGPNRFKVNRLRVWGASDGAAALAIGSTFFQTWAASPNSGFSEAPADFYGFASSDYWNTSEFTAELYSNSPTPITGTYADMLASQYRPNMTIRSIQAELFYVGRR